VRGFPYSRERNIQVAVSTIVLRLDQDSKELLRRAMETEEGDLHPWTIYAPHIQADQEAWVDQHGQIMWMRTGQRPGASGFRQLLLGREVTG
jgi:hypothetical protein